MIPALFPLTGPSLWTIGLAAILVGVLLPGIGALGYVRAAGADHPHRKWWIGIGIGLGAPVAILAASMGGPAVGLPFAVLVGFLFTWAGRSIETGIRTRTSEPILRGFLVIAIVVAFVSLGGPRIVGDYLPPVVEPPVPA